MSKIKFDKEQIESIFKHYSKEDALLITSDNNVFLATSAGKNLCRDHCKRVNATFATLTRSEFEAGATEVEVKVAKSNAGESTNEKGDKPSTKAGKKVVTQEDLDANPDLAAQGIKVGDEITIEGDWKSLKWDGMIAFAKTQGLEPTTLKNKGKVALIAEIETFIASKAIGATNTTNHIAE